jgi:hypothetical protein
MRRSPGHPGLAMHDVHSTVKERTAHKPYISPCSVRAEIPLYAAFTQLLVEWCYALQCCLQVVGCRGFTAMPQSICQPVIRKPNDNINNILGTPVSFVAQKKALPRTSCACRLVACSCFLLLLASSPCPTSRRSCVPVALCLLPPFSRIRLLLPVHSCCTGPGLDKQKQHQQCLSALLNANISSHLSPSWKLGQLPALPHSSASHRLCLHGCQLLDKYV